ncbi:MAG: 16S rRNA (cytidine(1402)-2'-O)-methyltransferase [Patescibacteria group bacterium]
MLYIVSTPIGNLKDITFRAVEVLKEVDLIAAEDTRHVQKLLNRYEIKKPVLSYHSYSGQAKLDKLAEALEEGKEIALVSDAGTPGISDPAYALIQKAIELGVQIVPVPGPSALLAALVASGMPMDKFVYLGFLPLKKGRQKIIQSIPEYKKTVVLFEAPHRIEKLLSELRENLGGDFHISLCRELTKIHEEIFRGTVDEAITHFEKKKPKGEFVVLLHS